MVVPGVLSASGAPSRPIGHLSPQRSAQLLIQSYRFTRFQYDVEEQSMFTTVTQVMANAGKAAEIKEFCLSLDHRIREEPGCLDHHTYLDKKDEHCFVMVTSWESEEAWQAHITSP